MAFMLELKRMNSLTLKKTISYILRYCGRPCFASYRIIDIDKNDFISFFYQRHKDYLFVIEKIVNDIIKMHNIVHSFCYTFYRFM